MGNVAVSINVMPSSPDADLNRIKRGIKKILGSRIKTMEEKPVAFGLKMVEVLVVLPDRGGTDEIEKKLSSIEGVESVKSGDITLI